ncbi:MAG: ABC transporter ATP-binding protein [Pseudomonadota bacterium]
MPNENVFFAIDKASYAFEDGNRVLHDIEWEVPSGAFHCLVGRSGCGKTTLLKLAAGLLQPSSGRISIENQPVLKPSQKVGFVFQTPALLEWLSVLENALLPISLHRRVNEEDRDAARKLLDLVGIADLEARVPAQLSGGQQSRVALVRALVTSPPALVMDEPFAALDAITRDEIQDDLLRLVALNQTTVLFVTHDIMEAVYLGDRVAVVDQGKILSSASISTPRPRDPNCRYDADFAATCQKIRSMMSSNTASAA